MTTNTHAIMNTFKVGDFAYGSWGYDQTNIDFYVVTRRTEKTIWLQPVQQQITEPTGYMSEYVEPTREPKQVLQRTYREDGNFTFVDNEMVDVPVQKFRVKSWQDGAEYICPKHGLIYPYDNKPKLQTHYH